jgi:hypothetical protein
MKDSLQRRIERAWRECKGWITEVTGLATEVYLMDIPASTLPQSVETLSQQSIDFRISIISVENEEQSQFVSIDSIKKNIDQFLSGQIAGLNINYTARLDGFDLDIHMIFHEETNQIVHLEFVWWSDQAFPDDVNHYDRFTSVIRYFIELQTSFLASKMFIGPENFEKPEPGSTWVEI